MPDVGSNITNTALEAWYRLPPNHPVAMTSVATVVSATTTVVTVDAITSSMVAGATVDFIQARSGCRIHSIDKAIVSTTSTSLTFASGDIPTTLVAGDYICMSGYSPVLNGIPDDAEPLTETLVAKRCLRAIGDFEGAKALDDDIKTEEEGFLKLIEPRIQGEPTVILNRTSLVRGRTSSRYAWLYR